MARRVYGIRWAQSENLFRRHRRPLRKARGNFAERKRTCRRRWRRRAIAWRSATGRKATHNRDRVSAGIPRAVILSEAKDLTPGAIGTQTYLGVISQLE